MTRLSKLKKWLPALQAMYITRCPLETKCEDSVVSARSMPPPCKDGATMQIVLLCID